MEVLFDARPMQLRVSCRGHESVFKVVPLQNGGRYRLAVYLYSRGDAVELLDEGTPLSSGTSNQSK